MVIRLQKVSGMFFISLFDGGTRNGEGNRVLLHQSAGSTRANGMMSSKTEV
jgi:hypothetical protein